MEHRVVALAKGGGFQEVLVALDASTDAEYPVVESAGGVLGCRGVTVTSRDMSPRLSLSSRVTHAGGHCQQSPADHLPAEP